MRMIFKYGLDWTKPGTQQLRLPEAAEFLSVQNQKGEVCLWFAVDLQATLETRSFELAVTGDNVPEGCYLGTLQLVGGDFVIHLFEVQS